MSNRLLLLPFLLLPYFVKAQNFTMRPVKCGMEMPWEITYGPDNFIWTTEARGYKVSRINPTTGASTVLLDLSNNKNFVNYPSVSPQGGLMGMALHPNLLSGKPYVYLAYVFRYDGGAAPTGYFFKTKLVRYTYNSASQTLANEEVICDTIPGSNDHNGGRMTIANVNGTPYLYYGVGDMGAGQFNNANRVHKAQDPSSYEGKILRFNLEPDADANAFEKWIPNDGLNTFGRAVWSIGHRNPQGLVAGANGNLYEAEHGPYSDDELNLISAGRNYGFPLVVGMADGNYNNAAVGEGTSVPFILNEATNAANLGANYRNPLKTFFPWDNASVRVAYQNAVNNTPPVPNYYLSWNSIAPSGIAYYGSNAIPGWQNSILITSLKRRRVYRLQLDAAGTTVTSDTLPFFADMGRFRDLAISPDGTKIYVSCDSEGQTSGPTAGTTIDPPNKGCILEFTYTSSYCASKSLAPWELWTRNVTFNTLNNTSDKYKDYATLGYSDYTNLTTTVAKGQTYPLSILPPVGWAGYFTNVYCRVWIDFNKNNVFEDNEKVLEGTNANVFNTNVLIPTTAATGAVRMRVSLKQGGYPTACETFEKGEVEDYTINIGGTAALPDYELRSLSVTSPVLQNTSVPIQYTFINIGQSTNCTTTNGIRYYLSTDAIWSPNDINLNIGTGMESGPLNVLYPVSLNIALPANLLGTYYMIVVLDPDNTCPESNELNNYKAQPFVIQPNTAGKPDFTITNLVAPASMTAGQTYSGSVTVSNVGTVNNCGNEALRLVLSLDAVADASDIIVKENTIPAGQLTPNTTLTFSYDGPSIPQFTIPATVAAGVYKLLGVIDATQICAETNETNNTVLKDVTILSATTGSNDIALGITSTPSVYKPFSSQNFTISAKNNGNQAFTNVKIEFKFPTGTTNGGVAIPSVGTWNEWCTGGIQCFLWTIPSLVANTTATLTVPIYVLNPTSPLVATAKLLNSTPVDNLVSNNTATISLTAAPPPIPSIRIQPTQLIPIVVEKISPNPTDGEVIIQLESLDSREVRFDFSDAFGKTVKTDIRKVEKGRNRVLFDVFELPQGIYFVSPSTSLGHHVPTKFVKM
jgi:PQQ-dependent dehydrogenase (s-GDH family)